MSDDFSIPDYKAFVLELTPSLDVCSAGRLPAGTETGQEGSNWSNHLWSTNLGQDDFSRMSASILTVNGRLFATASPFFQPVEKNLLVPDANDPDRFVADGERKWPRADDRFAALCCRKDSGDRDFSVPARAGAAYMAGYRPSTDWFALPSLRIPPGPQVDNSGTKNVEPQQLVYLDNSTTVFALFTPFPDNNRGSSRVITLCFTSVAAMGRLTSTSADTRWSLLNITSGSHGFQAACAVAVQPPDPSAPPILYVFAVDSRDNNPGRLWYMTLPLCGYDSMYGHPRFEPGTTTIDVADQAANNGLQWIDGNNIAQPINAEPTRPLKVVRYGNSLGVFHQSGGEIWLLKLGLTKNGAVTDPAWPQYRHMYREYTKVTSENSAVLVSACAMSTKFCDRFV